MTAGGAGTITTELSVPIRMPPRITIQDWVTGSSTAATIAKGSRMATRMGGMAVRIRRALNLCATRRDRRKGGGVTRPFGGAHAHIEIFLSEPRSGEIYIETAKNKTPTPIRAKKPVLRAPGIVLQKK